MATGAEPSDYVSTIVTVGGVIAAIIVAAAGRFKNPSTATATTRADVIDVFVREQALNRELLTRIVASNEAMVSIMQSSALEERIAREIATRLREITNSHTRTIDAIKDT